MCINLPHSAGLWNYQRRAGHRLYVYLWFNGSNAAVVFDDKGAMRIQPGGVYLRMQRIRRNGSVNEYTVPFDFPELNGMDDAPEAVGVNVTPTEVDDVLNQLAHPCAVLHMDESSYRVVSREPRRATLLRELGENVVLVSPANGTFSGWQKLIMECEQVGPIEVRCVRPPDRTTVFFVVASRTLGVTFVRPTSPSVAEELLGDVDAAGRVIDCRNGPGDTPSISTATELFADHFLSQGF